MNIRVRFALPSMEDINSEVLAFLNPDHIQAISPRPTRVGSCSLLIGGKWQDVHNKFEEFSWFFTPQVAKVDYKGKKGKR